MTYEPKNGTGGLWKNQNATTEKHPAAKGYILAHRDIKQGERLDLAAWTKTDRHGNKWQSLKMEDEYKKPDEAPGQPADQPDPGADTARELNDEIPF